MTGFGLAKKLSIKAGFAFSNKGLKSHVVQFRMKKGHPLFLECLFHNAISVIAIFYVEGIWMSNVWQIYQGQIQNNEIFY